MTPIRFCLTGTLALAPVVLVTVSLMDTPITRSLVVALILGVMIGMLVLFATGVAVIALRRKSIKQARSARAAHGQPLHI